jgi:flagellar hook-associated protein 2
LNAQTAVNPTTGSTGVLASDSTLGLVQDELFNGFNYSGTGAITSLGTLGLNLQNDGTIQLNTATLTSELNTNFSAVQNFFQSTTTGAGQALTAALSNLTDPTQGPIALDEQGIANTQQDLTSQINDINANLAQEQITLTNKYAAVNVVLQELPVLQQQISSQLASL